MRYGLKLRFWGAAVLCLGGALLVLQPTYSDGWRWLGFALYAISGVYAVRIMSSRETDPEVDQTLRETAGEGAKISGHAVSRRSSFPRIYQQCVASASPTSLSIVTAADEQELAWREIAGLRGWVDGPMPHLFFRRSGVVRRQIGVRPRDGEPIEEFVAAIPDTVKVRVRRWTYNPQLAWARWLLLAVTAGWVSAFLIDIAFGSLRAVWFIALAALFACWAIWAALSLGKNALAPYLSFYFVSITGLLMAMVTFWPRASESLLNQVYGDSLITGSLATLIFLFWAERAMPRVNRVRPAATSNASDFPPRK